MHVQTDLDNLKKLSAENQQEYVNKNIKIKATVITPMLANQILIETEAAGFLNRKISNSQVSKLAGVMSRGQWNPATGETIAVTTEVHNGKKLRVLLNGQHRFRAVTRCSKSIVVLMVSGVSRESFKEMDQGKARDIKAMAQIVGWRQPAQTTGAAELYYSWKEKGSPLAKISGYTKPEIFQFICDLDIKEELEETVDKHWNVVEAAKVYPIQPKITLLLLMLWNRQNPEFVNDIANYLIDPEKHHMTHSPVFEFTFNRLLKQFELDRSFLGNTLSRMKQMEYLLKLLCLAWAVHCHEIHPCVTPEDFEELVEVYLYNDSTFTLTGKKQNWIDIFKLTYSNGE